MKDKTKPEPKKKTFSTAKAEEMKAGGFIPQRQKATVAVRCKAPGGRIAAARLRKIAEVAEKYGQGIVHLSVRMSPEILYVKMEDLEAVVNELAEVGQEIASCGKRFRVTTACGGCEYNPNGWTNTQALAQESTQRFFGTNTPHKFKTSYSGCPIDCMRAREMDLGFQGMAEPKLIPEKCTACTLCVRACQDNALKMEGDLPVRNWENCISCGDCIKVCPFDAMVPARVGHAVYVGGKHGKHPHAAYPVAQFVPDEKTFAAMEKTMEWYNIHGQRGERIGETLDRVGLGSYRAFMRETIGEHLIPPEDLRLPKWRRIFWRGVAEAFPDYEAD